MKILLDNYSELGTFIVLSLNNYSIAKKDKINAVGQGDGGFISNKLVGTYIIDDRFYILYDCKSYVATPDNLSCFNNQLNKEQRRFIINIGDTVICDIIYKPYISPLQLAWEEDEDEFDFSLYLYKHLKNRESIINYINYRKILNSKYNGYL